MKYLLVIDMQEDYLGETRNFKKYPYNKKELITNINARIAEYPSEAVIYVTNKFFWEFGKNQKKLVDGLSIVSNSIFEKKRTSCFSNKSLLEYLLKINATELELVGVDGNYCVGISSLEGRNNQFIIYFNQTCIGIGNKKKFLKTKLKLEKAGVKIIY